MVASHRYHSNNSSSDCNSNGFSCSYSMVGHSNWVDNTLIKHTIADSNQVDISTRAGINQQEVGI